MSIGGVLSSPVLWPAYPVIQAALSLGRAGLNPSVWLLAIVVGGAVGALGGIALVRVLRAAGV